MLSRNSVMLALVLMVFLFSACKRTVPPVLEEFGPVRIKVGQDFNVQGDGTSALWARTENATKTTVIVWEETQLVTTFGSAAILSALVPKALYAKPGRVNIYLLDTKTGAKSNVMSVTVE